MERVVCVRSAPLVADFTTEETDHDRKTGRRDAAMAAFRWPSPDDTNEPDYTLTITKRDELHFVHEGGEEISKGFATRAEAEGWTLHHAKWYQPQCVCCGSRIYRPDDPWETVQVSMSD